MNEAGRGKALSTILVIGCGREHRADLFLREWQSPRLLFSFIALCCRSNSKHAETPYLRIYSAL